MVMLIDKDTIKSYCYVGAALYEVKKEYHNNPNLYSIVAHTVQKIEMDFLGVMMVQCDDSFFLETEFGRSIFFTEEQAKNSLQKNLEMWRK